MRKGFTLIELMIVIAIIAIIAAIAIPNLLESRVTANESAASATLKSGVFAAEVQFQGGGEQDADVDNVGEYGTLGMLAGKDATTKASGAKMLQGPLAAAAAAATSRGASNYMFWSIVPSLTNESTGVTTLAYIEGGAYVVANAAVPGTTNANNGEKYFLIGCMPDKYGDTGRRVFLMCQDGQVRTPPAASHLNAWYGGAAPTASTGAATIAKIQAGLGDAYDATYAITMLDTAVVNQTNYPTYAK